MPSTIVTRPSVRRTGLSSVRPVLALPAASVNMTAAVTVVQTIPVAECRGWYPAASTRVDWTNR